MSAQYAIAGVQLASGYFASQNIKDTAALNRDIAEMNAEFAELDAYDSLLQGKTAVAKYQTVIDQTLSDQQVAFAAADVDINFGSAAALVEETDFVAELNRMEIEKRSQEKSLGYEREARGIRFGADLQLGREEARAASVLFQSGLQATQTALSGYQRSQ